MKCPYSIRSDDPNTSRKSFYLVDTPNGKQLNQKSNYYYQIQGQLAVCDRAYCDFVCWTPVGMFIQLIERDDHFFSRDEEQARYVLSQSDYASTSER